MWPIVSQRKRLPQPRSYSGAQVGRLVADWFMSSSTADNELRSSLSALRNRSRQLGRDVDYVKNFFGLLQDNVVGTGIPFKARILAQRGGGSLDLAKNAKIEAAWKRWCKKDSCHVAGQNSFASIERLLIKTCAQDGEFFVRKVKQKFGSSKVPLALELIEAERLDESYNLQAKGSGNEIRMGVEVDKWRRPVAYHFLLKSPGDISSSNIEAVSEQRLRIPAAEIIHGFIPDAMNQTRGAPWMHAAIVRLHHLAKYEEAEVIGARANASLMGFIETPEEESSIDDATDAGQSVTEFEPGVFKKLNPGEKANIQGATRPGGQFEPFVRLVLRGVAAGLGCSYESLSRDYSQTNYSSARQGMLTDRDHWKAIQGWLMETFHQNIFSEWLELAVLFGEIDLKDFDKNKEAYEAVKWLPRGWGWVDPQKEVSAYKDAVRSGFKTQSAVIAETGGDFDEFIEERKHETEIADEADLIFDTDPSKVNDKGQEQGTTSGAPPDNTQ